MVGRKVTNDSGEIVPIRAIEARKAAGVTDYEKEWDALQEKLDGYGIPKVGRIDIPIREISNMPEVANVLHGLANDITAIYSKPDEGDFSKLLEIHHKIRFTLQKLKSLGR